MTNLSVAYKSQWDGDAGKTANDCGPASIAMLLNYYGENLTTDMVFEKTGAGSGLISWPQLQKAISAFGYVSHLERSQSLPRLRQLIDLNCPVIVLVHYGSLKSTQDKNFKGGHFFLMVGYHDGGFFVNDSNFKDALRNQGDHHNYETSEFDKAWADCTVDGNQAYSLLWVERKKPVASPTVIPDWITKNSDKWRGLAWYLGYSDAENTEVTVVKEKFDSMLAELKRLNNEVAHLSLTVGDMQYALSSKDSEIKQIQDQFTPQLSMKQAEIDRLKSDLLSSEETKKAYQKTIETLTKSRDDAEAELVTVKDNLSKKEEALQLCKAGTPDLSINELLTKLLNALFKK